MVHFLLDPSVSLGISKDWRPCLYVDDINTSNNTNTNNNNNWGHEKWIVENASMAAAFYEHFLWFQGFDLFCRKLLSELP